ncbi:MAG: cation diffusion facilitator family transporter [Burkholderiales bacterium]|nr:cation diffusion facilitator family transporter [Burkholderiales bacterium]
MKLERWGWYSVGVSALLAALHGLIALASGSLAVTAELVHNLVDLMGAATVLTGLKLAVRRTKAFPYGLYKAENLAAAAIAGLIFLTAYEIASNALFAPSAPVRSDPWMLALLIATAAIPLAFSHFELRAGRAANSPVLVADAREYRVHVLTTGLALAALASERFALPLDRVAALLIVLAVVKTGWDLLADAMRVLLDASLPSETLLRIRAVIGAEPAVAEVKWVTGRNAGRFRFVEAGVALRIAELDKAAKLVHRIEAEVRKAVPHVERVLAHIEAPASPHVRYAAPLADPAGAVSAHFGEAPYFALVAVGREDGAWAESRVVANPHATVQRAKGIRVAEWLVRQKVDVVLTREDLRGKGPVYVLRDAGVELRLTDKHSLAEALAAARDS